MPWVSKIEMSMMSSLSVRGSPAYVQVSNYDKL